MSKIKKDFNLKIEGVRRELKKIKNRQKPTQKTQLKVEKKLGNDTISSGEKQK
jgi:hypothetical protein